MLQERNQCRRHGYDLAGTHVHVVHVRRVGERELVLVPDRYEVIHELAVGIQLRVCLRNDVLALLDGRQVLDVCRRLAVHDLAVRRLEETVLVGA